MFTYEQQQEAVREAAFQQEVARGLENIFQAYPTILRCEANSRLIASMCREFHGADVAPSLDTFRSLVELNEGVLENFAQRPVERQKAQLVEDILDLLASKNNGRDGKYDSFNLKSEKTRMGSWSLDALRTRLNEIRTKQQMASQSVATLKAAVAEARADHRRYPGFPELPKTVWWNGSHVPVNAAFFRGLDAFEIRRYNRLFSEKAVNDRIKETA
jgi:hypothetical protein